MTSSLPSGLDMKTFLTEFKGGIFRCGLPLELYFATKVTSSWQSLMSIRICLSTEIRLVSSFNSPRTECVRSIDMESGLLLTSFAESRSQDISLCARSSSTPLYISSDRSKKSIMPVECFSVIVQLRSVTNH